MPMVPLLDSAVIAELLDSATLDEETSLELDSATAELLAGAALELDSAAPSTVNVTYSDIHVSPELSVTTATAECVPAARFLAVTWYGAVVDVPTSVLPT